MNLTEKTSKLMRIVPAGFYNGLIWFLSSRPIFIDISGFDKTAHIIEYGILGFLLSLGLSMSQNNFDKKAKYAIVLGLILGTIDEIHQYFVPGRSTDIIDIAADFTGITLGILIWFSFIKLLNQRRNEL
jgi:VanZ family protein